MWIPFALLAGLGDALRDALSKKASASIPRPLITWSYTLCALPFFLPTLARTMPDSLPLWMWWMLLGVASLHVLGGLMLVKALQLSDLSLCIPLIAFTPVFR
jgi:drug/metabolite transporter (DMT)-like permease